MPRFYFDIHDGFTSMTDHEGADLPDRELANAFASGLMTTLGALNGRLSRVLIRCKPSGDTDGGPERDPNHSL